MKRSVQLSLAVAGVFIFVILLSSFVFAADPIAALFNDVIKPQWTKWVAGEADTGIAKLLLAFLITVVIFGVSDMLPIAPNNTGVRWAFSIIAAILSTLFIKSDELFAIFISWSALGITLSMILPILILGYISFRLATKGSDPTTRVFNVYMSQILWLVLLLAVCYKIGVGMNDGKVTLYNPLVWIAILVPFLFLIFVRTLFKHFREDALEAAIESASETRRKARAAVRENARDTDAAADPASEVGIGKD